MSAPPIKTKAIGPYVRVTSGFPFPSSGFREDGSGVPLIRIRDLLPGRTETYYVGSYDPAFLIKTGETLVGMDGDFNCVDWAGDLALLNQRVCKITGDNQELMHRYLRHWLPTELQRIHRKTPQTTVRHLSVSDIELISIPFFSAAEQICIADVLDTLDEAIRGTASIINKLLAAKQGLIRDLLTNGIDHNGDRRDMNRNPSGFVSTKLGNIPRSWRVARLSDCCQAIVDCPHSTPKFLSQGVLVARTMHIKEGQFDTTLASRVSEDEYRVRVARLEPAPGDIIFTREAPVGEAFVVPAEMKICLGQRVMLLRPDPSVVLGEYLVAQIYSGVVQSRIKLLTGGTTNPHLNVAEVRGFTIPIPPVEEQKALVEVLQRYEGLLQTEKGRLDKLESLKSGLSTDLLTGRVRVPDGASA